MLRWNLPEHTRRGLSFGAAAGLLLATLALAACGAAGRSSSTAGGAVSSSASATSRVGSIPGGGMAVRPCTGQISDAASVGALALTLTPSHSTGSLHVGQLAQVRLPATDHWTLTGQPAHLTGVGEAGGQDTTLNVCYWTFRADSAGTITLYYSGAPPCDPPAVACSNVMIAQQFTITVS